MAGTDKNGRPVGLPVNYLLSGLYNGKVELDSKRPGHWRVKFVEVKANGFLGRGFSNGVLLSKNNNTMADIRPQLHDFWRAEVYPRIKHLMMSDEQCLFECCVMDGGASSVKSSPAWSKSLDASSGGEKRRRLPISEVIEWEGGRTDFPSLWKNDMAGRPVRFILWGSTARSWEDLPGLWETPLELQTIEDVWHALLTEEGVVAVFCNSFQEKAYKFKLNMFNPVPLFLVAARKDPTKPHYTMFYLAYRDGDCYHVVAVSDYRRVIVDSWNPNGKSQIMRGCIGEYSCTDSKSLAAKAFHVLNVECHLQEQMQMTGCNGHQFKSSSGSMQFNSDTFFFENPEAIVFNVGTNLTYFGKTPTAPDVRLHCVAAIGIHVLRTSTEYEQAYSHNGQAYPFQAPMTGENLMAATSEQTLRNPDRARHFELVYPVGIPPTVEDVMHNTMRFHK